MASRGSGRSSSRSGGRSGFASISSADLSTAKGLEELGRQVGEEPPEEKKSWSALQTLSRILNVGTATVAGATRGIISKEKTIGEGIQEGLEKNISFSDIIREDLNYDPQTTGGKTFVAVTGFVADVLFDPITYLSFGLGTGLKVSGKVLTKSGTSLAQQATREVITKKFATYKGMGLTDDVAASLSQKKVTGVVNDLVRRTFGKKGITQKAAEDFISQGVSRGTIESFQHLGSSILDKGGVKFMGKTLVKSETLAKTPIGKAAKRLGETNIVNTLKNTLGKTFVADFGKNPQLVSLLEKGNRLQKQAVDKIIKNNEQLFKGLNDDEMSEFFNKVFEKKLEIAKVGTGEARVTAKAAQKVEKLSFLNPKLQELSDKLFEGKDAIVSRLAKTAGIPEEEAIKFYLPSKFRDKLLVKDFTVGRNLSSPSMGFQKLFTGVENKELIRNPFEALSRGQIEAVTARIKTSTFNSTIRALGTTVKEVAQKNPDWVRVSRKGVEGEVEGWVPKAVADELNKFLTPELKTVDELARASGFDYVTGLFKSYVTSLFPAFHIRNITSGQFQNMLKIGVDVFNPSLQTNAIRIATGNGLDKVITTKAGKQFTLRSIKEAIEKESDILTKGAYSNTEVLLKDSVESLTKTGGKLSLNPFSREFFALKGGRRVGEMSDAQAKVVSILSAVAEGKTIKEGIKQAEEALFNYGKLTEFERGFMRRLIPFYTFARKNAELQIRTLATSPGKIATQLKGIKAVGEAIGTPLTEEDEEGLAPWVLNSLGIKAGVDKSGRSVVLTGFGLPIEEFLQRFSGTKGIVWNVAQNLMAQANPIIKFPAERASGVDFFRGRPITEITNGASLVSFIEILPDGVAEEFKDLVNFREIPNQPVYVNGVIADHETKYYADPFALHLFRNIPTSRIMSESAFLSDPSNTNWQKLLKGFTGVKGWSIDQEAQAYWENRDRMDQLETWLKNIGIVESFEKVYIPK